MQFSELTADEHKAEAAKCDQKSRESWERSDTDGFLSQWANDLTARQHRVEAEIQDEGGTAIFVGLYEGDRRVRATCVSVFNQFTHQNDLKWVVDDDDPICSVRKWIPSGPRSRIQKKMGLRECKERAPARAVINGEGTGLSGTAWVATIRTGCRNGYDAILEPNE